MNLLKTTARAAIALIAAALMLALQHPAYAAKESDAQKFINRRTATCWVEGMVLDDLVMGARGRLTFLYVDSKMGAAIRKQGTIGEGSKMPSDMAKYLFTHTGKYGDRKGSVMIALGISAFKPWDFDTSLISVAGFTPTKDDIVTGVTGDSRSEIRAGVNYLATDYNGMLSFYVPASLLKPGEEVVLGYGEYSTTWKVPAKNE